MSTDIFKFLFAAKIKMPISTIAQGTANAAFGKTLFYKMNPAFSKTTLSECYFSQAALSAKGFQEDARCTSGQEFQFRPSVPASPDRQG